MIPESKINQNYSRYDAMTTEELEEILREDALETDANSMDAELLLTVMEVYAQRKKDEPHRSAEESYAQFRRTHPPESKPKTHRLRPLVATAAVLALVLCVTLTAHAQGFNFWGAVARWTSDFLYFEEPTNAPSNTDPFEIFEKLKPTWMPDGYVLIREEIQKTPSILTYAATYLNNDLEINATYMKSDCGQAQIHKNDKPVELYERNGITFYLIENTASRKIVWYYDGFVCSIHGTDVSFSQLKQIADSINLK